MPRHMQDAFPPPQSIMAWNEILEDLQTSLAGGALEGALLCVLELGMLVGYVTMKHKCFLSTKTSTNNNP